LCCSLWLASDKAESIDFDTSIFSQGHYGRIRTFESGSNDRSTAVQYTIEESLFQFSSLVGRGTICWLCSRPDHFNSTFVVKDAWISPSVEGSSRGPCCTMPNPREYGLVFLKSNTLNKFGVEKMLPTLTLCCTTARLNGVLLKGKKIDRVHTRIVMETHGKTLDKFTSRREFLLAFQDAVLGMKCGHSRVNFLTNLLTAHRNLHQVARILHRDISIRNILINPEGVKEIVGFSSTLIMLSDSKRPPLFDNVQNCIPLFLYMNPDLPREF